MKKISLFFFLFASIAIYAQVDANAFRVNSSGDVQIRRHSSADAVWKTALTPIFEGLTPYLHVNYNNQFSGGVSIGGTTQVNTLYVNGVNTTSSKILSFGGNDVFTFNSNTIPHYGLARRTGNNVTLAGYNSLEFFTYGTLRMKVADSGNVGIGTANPDEKLTVKGKIHAEEIKVDLAVPADYVFQKYFTGSSTLKPDYQMPSLNEIESFVKENHHLPNIPSASEIQQNGLQLGEMNNLLLQKVEELTLYIIEQNKRIEALEAKTTENN